MRGYLRLIISPAIHETAILRITRGRLVADLGLLFFRQLPRGERIFCG